MIKKCKWCGQKYDTSKGQTSLFCIENPNREFNRRYKKLKPKIVKIGCLTLKNRKFPKK